MVADGWDELEDYEKCCGEDSSEVNEDTDMVTGDVGIVL